VKTVLVQEPDTVVNMAAHLSDATGHSSDPMRDGDKIPVVHAVMIRPKP
jgi:hypothetical protein